MKVTIVEKQNDFQNPHGVSARNILTTENAEVIHMVLEPGQSLRRRITPVDVKAKG